MSNKDKKDKKVSLGSMNSVNPKICASIRRDRSLIDNLLIAQKAWKAKQNPWITIDNPNQEETRARRVRVRANSYWGFPEAPIKKKNQPLAA